VDPTLGLKNLWRDILVSFKPLLFKRVNVCRYASALSLGDERWIWLRPCVVLASVVALRYEFQRRGCTIE
jgi:hypothetical protein